MPTDFTPLASLGGGILIGLAAVLLMAIFGRVMGATSILVGFLMPTSRSNSSWRASLLAGMVSAPVLVWLIVGVGVTFGGGCTSAHGVCGIARLSPRSLVAMVVFMFATVVKV